MNERDELLAELRTWKEKTPAHPGAEMPSPSKEKTPAHPGAEMPSPSEEMPSFLPAMPSTPHLPEQITPVEDIGTDLPSFQGPAHEPAALPPTSQRTEAATPLPSPMATTTGMPWQASSMPLPAPEATTLPEMLSGADRPATMPERSIEGQAAPSFSLPELPLPEPMEMELPPLLNGKESAKDIPEVPEAETGEAPLLPGLLDGANGRTDTVGSAEDLTAGMRGSNSGGEVGGGRVVDLLEKILTVLEKLSEGGLGGASGGNGRTASGQGPIRHKGSLLEPIDLEADEGFPQASPSVNVSTVPGTGGAGGHSLGSRIPTPQTLLAGGRGRPKPGPGRSSFLEPGK